MNVPFEKYLNCQLEDIVITGFSEFVGSNFVFHPLCRWLYLIIDTNFLLLDSNDGNILVKECSEIIRNSTVTTDPTEPPAA